MKNINIPEPCSEDWSKMTPNEKGAFCQKCSLDVYDFTNKSADQIRQVLALNMPNPVCMRLEPQQLDQLNNDFSAWKVQNKQSYQRAWLFTLLVVFGMTLFSCEEDEEPVVKEYQKIGQTILNQTEEKVIDPVVPKDLKIETNTSNDSKVIESDAKDLVNQAKVAVLGKARMDEESEPEKVYMVREVQVFGEVHAMRETHALGGVPMISSDYNDYLVLTTPGVITHSSDFNFKPKITGLVYPNPASNQTTVQVNMPKRGKGEIELFTLSGQKIRTIHSGRIKKGESEYPIDLTGLETGMYLVVVYSGDMKETIKFSKI